VSARQAEQAQQNIEKQATPAAEDACGLCGYWRCRCGENVNGGVR
jgi:hypothetical protein